MAYCSSCGEVISEKVKFCPYCGNAIVKKNEESIKQVAPSELYVPVTMNSNSMKPVSNTTDANASAKRANGFSIAGFVLSLTFIYSWIGIIFGAIGLGFSKKFRSGKGLGLAAVIIGGVITLLFLSIMIPDFWTAFRYGFSDGYVFDAIFTK